MSEIITPLDRYAEHLMAADYGMSVKKDRYVFLVGRTGADLILQVFDDLQRQIDELKETKA